MPHAASNWPRPLPARAQMLRRLPGQVASGDWVAAVRWDSNSATPRPRLLLDMNDAALTFRCRATAGPVTITFTCQLPCTPAHLAQPACCRPASCILTRPVDCSRKATCRMRAPTPERPRRQALHAQGVQGGGPGQVAALPRGGAAAAPQAEDGRGAGGGRGRRGAADGALQRVQGRLLLRHGERLQLVASAERYQCTLCGQLGVQLEHRLHAPRRHWGASMQLLPPELGRSSRHFSSWLARPLALYKPLQMLSLTFVSPLHVQAKQRAGKGAAAVGARHANPALNLATLPSRWADGWRLAHRPKGWWVVPTTTPGAGRSSAGTH
jgi:hypothetical protein